MNKHICSLLLAGTALALVSCGGGKSKNSGGAAATVYAAGYELGTDSKNHAMLWTDGAAKQLSGNPSYANSVFVSGGAVYVAGYEESSDGGRRATLWKNGVAQSLSNRYSEAASVFVSGNNVYVAGQVEHPQNDNRHAPALWTDGSVQNLSDYYATTSLTATSVFVSGSDVYVGGLDVDYNNIWKNGVAMNVNPKDIARINSVYASGSTLHCAASWRENDLSRAVTVKVVGSGVTHQYLDEGWSEAKSVFVSGSNVYAAGYTGGTAALRRAKVWKDGTAQPLSNLRSEASSVFVSGGDVYVGGHEYAGGDNASDQRARVWKNGAAQNLSNRQSSVASVYVVK